ncbi:hypothetical protein AVEN_153572-1, partial [Araneus ventricosus]
FCRAQSSMLYIILYIGIY